MKEIAFSDRPRKLRNVRAIDATYGWIPDVTLRDDEPVGLGVLEDILTAKEAVLTIDLVQQGFDPGHPTETFESRWPLRDYYTGSGRMFELWAMAKVHLARVFRDGRVGLRPHCFREEIRKGNQLEVAYSVVAGYLDRLEETLARFRPGHRPPVFIEGGLDLLSRATAELALRMGFPVVALENCWLPSRVLVACEAGAAVNRWNFAPRFREDTEWGVWPRLDQFAIDPAERRGEHGYGYLHPYPEPDRPAILVLGQICHDASVVDQWSNGVLPEELPELLAPLVPPNTQIRYRPHPGGEPTSLIDGKSCTYRMMESMVEKDVELVVSRANTLGEEFDAFEAHACGSVVTVNSQSGWQAARRFRTFAAAPGWWTNYPVVTPFARTESLSARHSMDTCWRKQCWHEITLLLCRRAFIEKGEAFLDRIAQIVRRSS